MEHNRMNVGDPITVYALGRSQERLHLRFADYEADSSFHYVVQDIRAPLPDDLTFTYMINGASNAHPAAYAKDPVGTILINIQGLTSLLSHAVGPWHKTSAGNFVDRSIWTKPWRCRGF